MTKAREEPREKSHADIGIRLQQAGGITTSQQGATLSPSKNIIQHQQDEAAVLNAVGAGDSNVDTLLARKPSAEAIFASWTSSGPLTSIPLLIAGDSTHRVSSLSNSSAPGPFSATPRSSTISVSEFASRSASGSASRSTTGSASGCAPCSEMRYSLQGDPDPSLKSTDIMSERDMRPSASLPHIKPVKTSGLSSSNRHPRCSACRSAGCNQNNSRRRESVMHSPREYCPYHCHRGGECGRSCMAPLRLGGWNPNAVSGSRPALNRILSAWVGSACDIS